MKSIETCETYICARCGLGRGVAEIMGGAQHTHFFVSVSNARRGASHATLSVFAEPFGGRFAGDTTVRRARARALTVSP